MSQVIPNRIVIYTKDVINITGKKEQTSRKLLKKIRKHLGKSPKDYITIEEFSKFTKISVEAINKFIV